MSSSWEQYRSEAEAPPPLLPHHLIGTSSPAAQQFSSTNGYLQTPPSTVNVDYSNESPRPIANNPGTATHAPNLPVAQQISEYGGFAELERNLLSANPRNIRGGGQKQASHQQFYRGLNNPQKGSMYPKPALRPAVERDPYQHIDFLGSGAYRYVDTVKSVVDPGAVFARKTIRITTGRNRETQLKSVETEFGILRRLEQHHVIQVLELYSFRNKLSIIMLQVADTDMKEYLEKLDTIETGLERHNMLKPLLMWQGCLIQAIDYLHEMKIKHKDLKPANILLKDGHVLITDFGIAKDLIDEETTASITSGSAQGSPMYMAPEIGLEDRRGRAVDIFSLGCIFLEISTCLIAGPGARARFAEYRNLAGSRAYSRCPSRILSWIWYLWGWYAGYNVFRTLSPLFPDDSKFVYQTILPGELAFMMLDPNPKTRITSRQLVHRIHTKTKYVDRY